jgi:small subunit ribosomal protein S16
MLVIRFFRVGKKNQPAFKIVVTEKINPPRGGRFVEEVGFYNSRTKEKVINKERFEYWISKGAQPSATVHNLLVREGILKSKKIDVHKKSKAAPAAAPAPEVKKEPAPAAEAPKEEAAPAPAAKPAEPTASV